MVLEKRRKERGFQKRTSPKLIFWQYQFGFFHKTQCDPELGVGRDLFRVDHEFGCCSYFEPQTAQGEIAFCFHQNNI